jgi:hypothetical protein
MGRRLDGFDIDLQFDNEGKVSRVSYHDSEGCGAERPISPDMTVGEVIAHHLAHYKSSHAMEPAKKCDFTAVGQQDDAEVTFYCILEPHSGTFHTLKLKQEAW